MFKTIIQGNHKYFCDVCLSEIKWDDKISISYQNFWKQKSFHLCSRHGKLFEQWLREMKTELLL